MVFFIPLGMLAGEISETHSAWSSEKREVCGLKRLAQDALRPWQPERTTAWLRGGVAHYISIPEAGPWEKRSCGRSSYP